MLKLIIQGNGLGTIIYELNEWKIVNGIWCHQVTRYRVLGYFHNNRETYSLVQAGSFFAVVAKKQVDQVELTLPCRCKPSVSHSTGRFIMETFHLHVLYPWYLHKYSLYLHTLHMYIPARYRSNMADSTRFAPWRKLGCASGKTQ